MLIITVLLQRESVTQWLQATIRAADAETRQQAALELAAGLSPESAQSGGWNPAVAAAMKVARRRSISQSTDLTDADGARLSLCSVCCELRRDKSNVNERALAGATRRHLVQ